MNDGETMFILNKHDVRVLLIAEVERRFITWDEDSRDGSSWETVYLLTSGAWNQEHEAEIVYILDRYENGPYYVGEPKKLVYDGKVFCHKVTKEYVDENVPDLAVHLKRVGAILVLLNTGSGVAAERKGVN